MTFQTPRPTSIPPVVMVKLIVRMAAVVPVFPVKAPWATSIAIPARIKPPLTNSSAGTVIENAFLEIRNAIIDIITALPPKRLPLADAFRGINPDSSDSTAEEDAIATSIPYVTRRPSDIANKRREALTLFISGVCVMKY
jgi:hypothetical protein